MASTGSPAKLHVRVFLETKISFPSNTAIYDKIRKREDVFVPHKKNNNLPNEKKKEQIRKAGCSSGSHRTKKRKNQNISRPRFSSKPVIRASNLNASGIATTAISNNTNPFHIITFPATYSHGVKQTTHRKGSDAVGLLTGSLKSSPRKPIETQPDHRPVKRNTINSRS